MITPPNPINAVTYKWVESGTTTLVDPNELVAGQYDVEAHVQGCVPLYVTTLEVLPPAQNPAAASIAINTPNNVLCTPQSTITLTANPSVHPLGPNLDFEWRNLTSATPSQIIGTSQDLIVTLNTANAAGTYEVTVLDPYDCATSTATQDIVEGVDPVIALTAVPDQCYSGTDVELQSVVTSPTGGLTYEWTEATNPSFVLGTNTNYFAPAQACTP